MAARIFIKPGTKFGALTVMSQAQSGANGTRWNCLCDCGKDHVVLGHHLRRSRIVSCGCSRKANFWGGRDKYNESRSLAGKKYGIFTVVSRSDTPGGANKRLKWACLCDCGVRFEAPGTYIRSGATYSCGCKKRPQEDRLSGLSVGNTLGKFTVVSVLKGDLGGEFVDLQCVCGNTIRRRSIYLPSRGDCGCTARKREAEIAESKKRSDEDLAVSSLISVYKGGAKARVLKWELSKADVLRIVLKDCTYCGQPPVSRKDPHYRGIAFNGIDRIDSSLGYHEGNCCTCCTSCNLAKGKTPRAEFLGWVSRVAKHMGLA